MKKFNYKKILEENNLHEEDASDYLKEMIDNFNEFYNDCKRIPNDKSLEDRYNRYKKDIQNEISSIKRDIAHEKAMNAIDKREKLREKNYNQCNEMYERIKNNSYNKKYLQSLSKENLLHFIDLILIDKSSINVDELKNREKALREKEYALQQKEEEVSKREQSIANKEYQLVKRFKEIKYRL